MTPPLATAFVLTAVAGAAIGGAGAAAQEAAFPVRQTVLDIISYARWPDPRGEIRFCVVGQPVYAGAFFEGEVRSGATPVRPMRMGTGDERLGRECDAVYGGALAPWERDQVVRLVSGRPVLTVGEAGPGCVETTMFCLTVAGAQVSFATNLDAIARSGIRVNPRVLLLGRRPAAPEVK